MHLTQLNIKEIQEDFFFCFTSQIDNSALYESISKSGIRTPIQVCAVTKGYQIVSGFKRVSIARELGLQTLPAEIVDVSDIPGVFIDVLREQASLRPLNLVEKARAVGICDSLGLNKERIIQFVLPVLELPFRKDLFFLLKEIRDYPIIVQKYFEQYNVSLKKISTFSLFLAHDIEAVIKIANQLQMRPVELSEIMVILYEIGRRDSISQEQILNQLYIQPLIEDQEKSRSEKIYQLKLRLKEKRFPKLSAWQHMLEQSKKDLHLPMAAKMNWDSDLEAPGINLSLKLDTSESLNDLKSFFKKAETWEIFRNMLEII